MVKSDSGCSSAEELCLKWWHKVLEKVNKAVVFADAASFDCLNWFCNNHSDGLQIFFNAGAKNVKELSSFESGLADEKKAVFIISSPLMGMTLDAIRTTIQSSKFEHCIVVTPFSAGVHTFARSSKASTASHDRQEDDDEAFYFLEDCLLQWMGNMNYTVQVLHIPLCIATFMPSFFITPPLQHLYSLCHEQLVDSATITDLPEFNFNALPRNDQTKVKMLCDTFNALLNGLDMRDDVFTVGNFSRIFSKHFDALNATKLRRKNASNKASLILVDRSLDVSSAVSANTDCLMDSVVRCLPPFSEHVHTDVMVDVSFLIDAKSCKPGQSIIHGNFGHFSNEKCKAIIESSILNKQKQTVMEISRHVMEALNQQNIAIDPSILKSSKNPLDKIQKLVDLFRNNRQCCYEHKEVLQQALAIIDTLQSDVSSRMKNIVNAQKLLVLAKSQNNPQALCQEILRTINERHKIGLLIEDIFLLIIYIFQDGPIINDSSLLDLDYPFGHSIQTALFQALQQDGDSISEYFKSKIGQSEQDCFEFIKQFFARVSCLSNAFKGMKTYNSVFDDGNGSEPLAHKHVLKRIMDDIFSSERTDLTDVEYRSSGLGTMLKSGFGFFGGSGKVRPNDNPTVIIFVIGGITAWEVKQITETVKSKDSKVNIIVGSTKLIQPIDIFKSIMD